MATIEDIVAANILEAYTLPEWENRLPIRSLWVACEMWDVIDGCDEMHNVSKGVGRRSLFEHLEITFCDFVCAKNIPAGDLKRMMPTKNSVWKLHPPKLRIFGWCPSTHSFVAVTHALESETKFNKGLNDRKRNEVLTFIRRHRLQDCVARGDASAVFP